MSRSQTLISDCREHIQAVVAIVSPTFRVTIALVFTIFPLKRFMRMIGKDPHKESL